MNKKDYILVSGSSGFIGKYICKKLFELNYNLILVDINSSRLFQQRKELLITKKKSNIIIFKKNISNEKSIKTLLNSIKKKNINVFALINLAAIDTPPSKKGSGEKYISKKNWDKELGVGLTGSYLMIKHFGEIMYKKNFGRIINFGSDLSVISPNQNFYKSSYSNYYKPVSYSVIKHGLVGLTKYFATLHADKQVTCNMVSPGPVLNDQSSSLVSNIKKNTPMKRLANPKDLIGIIIFLISEESRFVTGQNIIVDGGKTLI
jgi:NAD(P)-dependent dehydrogenase (short-subunit alcohol dehydrogenase family)